MALNFACAAAGTVHVSGMMPHCTVVLLLLVLPGWRFQQWCACYSYRAACAAPSCSTPAPAAAYCGWSAGAPACATQMPLHPLPGIQQRSPRGSCTAAPRHLPRAAATACQAASQGRMRGLAVALLTGQETLLLLLTP